MASTQFFSTNKNKIKMANKDLIYALLKKGGIIDSVVVKNIHIKYKKYVINLWHDRIWSIRKDSDSYSPVFNSSETSEEAITEILNNILNESYN